MFQEIKISSLSNNETKKEYFINLGKVLGKVTLIIFFEKGYIVNNKTLLEHIYSVENNNPQNQFAEFFNQFFRVT